MVPDQACQSCRIIRRNYEHVIREEARTYAQLLAHRDAHANGESEEMRNLRLSAEDSGWSPERASEALGKIPPSG